MRLTGRNNPRNNQPTPLVCWSYYVSQLAVHSVLDTKRVSLQVRTSPRPSTTGCGWEVTGRPRRGSGCGGTGAQRRPSWEASGPAVSQLQMSTWPFPPLTVSPCSRSTVSTSSTTSVKLTWCSSDTDYQRYYICVIDVVQ